MIKKDLLNKTTQRGRREGWREGEPEGGRSSTGFERTVVLRKPVKGLKAKKRLAKKKPRRVPGRAVEKLSKVHEPREKGRYIFPGR